MAGKNYLIAFAGILKLLTQSSFSCNVTKEMEGGNSSFKTYLVTIVISTVIFEPEIISKFEEGGVWNFSFESSCMTTFVSLNESSLIIL